MSQSKSYPPGLFADTASEAMLSDLLAGSMGTPVLVNLAGWFDRFHTLRLIHSHPQVCPDQGFRWPTRRLWI